LTLFEESLKEFTYLKYWKPVGVNCTTSFRDPMNVIDQGKFRELPQRIFPVGRLDKETSGSDYNLPSHSLSSGLLLLTSDTRLDLALLHPQVQSKKVYNVLLSSFLLLVFFSIVFLQVRFTSPASDTQLRALQEGIDISVDIKRNNQIQHTFTTRTSLCEVTRLSTSPDKSVEITLMEGKNRQIRKMASAIGLRVETLHRTHFSSLSLDPLKGPGDWCPLDEKELMIVQIALDRLLRKPPSLSVSTEATPPS
jgi:23S rRNA pseudouridine2604 synthase